MPQKTLYYVGLLANTNSSILKLDLAHNFKIESLSEEEGTRFFSMLEDLPYYETGKKLFIDFPCLNSSEKKYYFISNSFERNIDVRKEDNWAWNMFAKFGNKFVSAYLEPTIRLLKLFKEGDIHLPLHYYFFISNSHPKPSFRKSSHLSFSRMSEFTVENSEAADLKSFIQCTRLPFARPFLQLSFDNFESSYNTDNMNLAYLSLVNSLEALFNRGQYEVRYTICRNTAVLLGENTKDSTQIFSEMKKLYDKRSDIVHGRSSKVVSKDDLLKLRHYVREAIKVVHFLDKDKDEVFELLNATGFSTRPWRKN